MADRIDTLTELDRLRGEKLVPASRDNTGETGNRREYEDG